MNWNWQVSFEGSIHQLTRLEMGAYLSTPLPSQHPQSATSRLYLTQEEEEEEEMVIYQAEKYLLMEVCQEWSATLDITMALPADLPVCKHPIEQGIAK